MIGRYLRLGAVIAISCAFFTLLYIVADRASMKHKIKNFEATERQFNERNETNEAVRNADDARKCELIGGVFADGACN